MRDYTGNFHQRSLTDVEIGNLSGQSCILASVRQDKKLDDRQLAFLQTAVLYTTAAGHRRVRVMNLSLPITSHIGNLFRFADFDACIVQTLREGDCQRDLERCLTLKLDFHSQQSFRPARDRLWTSDGTLRSVVSRCCLCTASTARRRLSRGRCVTSFGSDRRRINEAIRCASS